MTEPFTVLETTPADRRLLLKLQHRLLGAAAQPDAEAAPEDRRLALIFALAPMAFAFLYLSVLSFFLFR